MNPWIQFAIVIIAQLAVFLAFVYAKQVAWRKVFRIFGWSLLISIPFGIGFDLVAGYLLGVFSYELGFTPVFLFFNGLLSYGFAMASVALLDIRPFLYFYGFVVAKAVVYEVVNFYSPVWYWEFSDTFWIQEAAAIFVGYICLAVFMKIVYTQSMKYLRYVNN